MEFELTTLFVRTENFCPEFPKHHLIFIDILYEQQKHIFSETTLNSIYKNVRFKKIKIYIKHCIAVNYDFPISSLKFINSKPEINTYIWKKFEDVLGEYLELDEYSVEWLDNFFAHRNINIKKSLKSIIKKLSIERILWLMSRCYYWERDRIFKYVKKSRDHEKIITLIQKYPEVIGLDESYAVEIKKNI